MKKRFTTVLSLALVLVMISAILVPVVGYADGEEADANEIDPETLPSSATLVGTEHLPPISSQGSGSCVSQAVTYMLFTNAVSRYLHNADPDIEWNPSSGDRKYIFAPRFTFMLSGPGTDVVLNVLKENGCLTYEEFPFSSRPGSNTYLWALEDARRNPENYSWPTGEQFMQALNFRLTGWDHVWVDRSAAKTGGAVHMTDSDAGKKIINTIKDAVNRGNVVMTGGVCGGWTYKMIDRDGTGTLGKLGDQALIYNSLPTSGGHQVSIVGYDDNITCTVEGVQLKGAFLMANSWDTTWMNGGYVWVMYDALNTNSEFAELNTKLAAKGVTRTIAFDQFVFVYWDRDIAVNTVPDVRLEMDVSCCARENCAVYMIRSHVDSNGKDKIDTFKPTLFECGKTFSELHPELSGEDFPNVRFAFDGSRNVKTAQTNTFVFDCSELLTPEDGVNLSDYKFGAQIYSKDKEVVTVSSMRIVTADGTVISEVKNPEIAVSQSTAKSTKVYFDLKAAGVELPEADNFTVEAVTDFASVGNDYSFKVAVAEGYTADSMVVKVNGTAVNAVDGVYTVKATEANAVTVEGVVAASVPEGDDDDDDDNDNDNEEAGKSDMPTGVIIAVCAGIAVVVVMIVVLLCTRKAKKNPEPEDKQE